MKDSIDFGKVQTYEELKMLRELEKHYKKHPVKHKRKYSKDTSKRWWVICQELDDADIKIVMQWWSYQTIIVSNIIVMKQSI